MCALSLAEVCVHLHVQWIQTTFVRSAGTPMPRGGVCGMAREIERVPARGAARARDTHHRALNYSGTPYMGFTHDIAQPAMAHAGPLIMCTDHSLGHVHSPTTCTVVAIITLFALTA